MRLFLLRLYAVTTTSGMRYKMASNGFPICGVVTWMIAPYYWTLESLRDLESPKN